MERVTSAHSAVPPAPKAEIEIPRLLPAVPWGTDAGPKQSGRERQVTHMRDEAAKRVELVFGVISLTEFRPFVLDPERFGPTVAEFAEALSALGDPDGDGLIERPLFESLMTAIGFEQANIHALFDAFGPDADDRITVATWAAGIKDYYAPDKAGIPGDRLVTAHAV
ncbi:EF-hand domain-containing protein [Streptomyces albogriseolus]|uniref:EF-hand domain-containing protein n=1 Tax=Streptomyces albogriseolus TaxID=1887 RepID=UPI003CF5AEBB